MSSVQSIARDASPSAPSAPAAAAAGGVPSDTGGVPTLLTLCVRATLDMLTRHKYHAIERHIPRLPEEVADRLLATLMHSGKLNDRSLSLFFTAQRWQLAIPGCAHIRRSVLRQLGWSCPHLVTLDLTDCRQVNNAVVRSVLQGCAKLETLVLAGCHQVTDWAFQPNQSLFVTLSACLSLKHLSFARCPQVSDWMAGYLVKSCPNLTHLDFSHCKVLRVTRPCARLCAWHCVAACRWSPHHAAPLPSDSPVRECAACWRR